MENKELLLKYLCMALPYGIVLSIEERLNFKLDAKHQGIGIVYPEDCSDEFNKRSGNQSYYIIISGCYYGEDIKPYLRPMSSMTEEEKKEISTLLNYEFYVDDDYALVAEDDRHRVRLDLIQIYTNWLLENHFDFMDLIPKGLALEAPENMYLKGK